jgi:hypothetical protein
MIKSNIYEYNNKSTIMKISEIIKYKSTNGYKCFPGCL